MKLALIILTMLFGLCGYAQGDVKRCETGKKTPTPAKIADESQIASITPAGTRKRTADPALPSSTLEIVPTPEAAKKPNAKGDALPAPTSGH